jgi:hypothetical protein
VANVVRRTRLALNLIEAVVIGAPISAATIVAIHAAPASAGQNTRLALRLPNWRRILLAHFLILLPHIDKLCAGAGAVYD